MVTVLISHAYVIKPRFKNLKEEFGVLSSYLTYSCAREDVPLTSGDRSDLADESTHVVVLWHPL